MVDYNRSFCDALTNLYRAMYHVSEDKDNFHSTVITTAYSFLNSIPHLDDLTRNIWADELIKPLDSVIDLYDDQISDDNVCITDEQHKVLAVLCDYADSLIAVHTDKEVLTMLKLRYFMSYICELTYKFTPKHSTTHYF